MDTNKLNDPERAGMNPQGDWNAIPMAFGRCRAMAMVEAGSRTTPTTQRTFTVSFGVLRVRSAEGIPVCVSSIPGGLEVVVYIGERSVVSVRLGDRRVRSVHSRWSSGSGHRCVGSIPGGLRVRNPERNAEVVGLLYDVSTDACAQRVHLAPFTSPPCTTPRAHGNRPERK